MRIAGMLLAALPAATALGASAASAEAPREARRSEAKARAKGAAKSGKAAPTKTASTKTASTKAASTKAAADKAAPTKAAPTKAAPDKAAPTKTGSTKTASGKAAADQATAGKPTAAKAPPLGACTAELTARRVAWKPAARPGIAHAVEITGPLGGVTVSSPSGPLVIDCSLAVSLDEAGPYLRNLGIDAAGFSSAYSRRNVRGTSRPSKHSYGLAIDVHSFSGPDLGTVYVDRDYEQGLGDAVDCLGHPLTQGGAVLKLAQCQLARSGLFHLVLSPDFDDAHHDHFHLEVKPWAERTAVRAQAAAIH